MQDCECRTVCARSPKSVYVASSSGVGVRKSQPHERRRRRSQDREAVARRLLLVVRVSARRISPCPSAAHFDDQRLNRTPRRQPRPLLDVAFRTVHPTGAAHRLQLLSDRDFYPRTRLLSSRRQTRPQSPWPVRAKRQQLRARPRPRPPLLPRPNSRTQTRPGRICSSSSWRRFRRRTATSCSKSRSS